MSSDVVSLLSDLVRIPSVCGGEERIADFIATWLTERNLPAKMQEVKPRRPNIISELSGRLDGPSLMLNGHMDTVAPGSNWTYDPFGAEVEDGRMYGRGTVDMKSGLASILCALSDCRDEGLPKKGKIIVAAVVDEEAFDLGSYTLVQEGLTGRLDFAMVAEATDLSVVTAHRGRTVFDVVVHGRAAHSMWPDRGLSAINNAAILINSLPRLPSPNHAKMGRSTVNVLKIEGGQEDVMLVPDRCRLVIDRCLVPGHSSTVALDELTHLIKELGIEAEAQFITRETPFCDPFEIPEDDANVRGVIEAATSVLGTTPELGFHEGPCDSCILVNQGRVNTLEFGPSGGRLHQPDEFVYLDSVRKTTEVYKEIIRSTLS